MRFKTLGVLYEKKFCQRLKAKHLKKIFFSKNFERKNLEYSKYYFVIISLSALEMILFSRSEILIFLFLLFFSSLFIAKLQRESNEHKIFQILKKANFIIYTQMQL